MEFSSGNIRRRFETMPMVAVAVPLAVGIVFSTRFDVPPTMSAVAIAVSVAAAVFAVIDGRGGMANAMLFAALFSVGALRMALDAIPEPPYGKKCPMTVRFDEPTTVHGKSTYASARLVECDGIDFSDSPVRVAVWGHASLRFSRGDEITMRSEIRPFSPKNPAFAEYARCRGYVGCVSLHLKTVSGLCPAPPDGLHERAVAKLCRLLPDGRERGTILAMTTGERNAKSAEMRGTYARGGTAHLLAVSGLHVGIVFLLINALLRIVPIVRYGNIWRSLLAVGAIWLYVAMCGYPPSAVRAAAMFSVLQLSHFSSRGYSGVNALAATAAVMLLIEPRLLFDVGFRLSVVAVAAILLWGVPMYLRVRTRSRLLNAVLSAVVIGAVATAAVMPMVSNVFGMVAPVGIPLNPLVVVSANVIIFFAAASLLLPSPLATYALVPAYAFAWLQNEAVARAASMPCGCFDFRMPDWAVAAIYALFAAATVAGWGLRRKNP